MILLVALLSHLGVCHQRFITLSAGSEDTPANLGKFPIPGVFFRIISDILAPEGRIVVFEPLEPFLCIIFKYAFLKVILDEP